MTDTIEQKALALVNGARINPSYPYSRLGEVSSKLAINALCRAIEQHEAFRQEVSDAVLEWSSENCGLSPYERELFGKFIIAKPDPLVEVFAEIGAMEPKCSAGKFYAAIEKRGGKITWGEG